MQAGRGLDPYCEWDLAAEAKELQVRMNCSAFRIKGRIKGMAGKSAAQTLPTHESDPFRLLIIDAPH